MEIDEKSQIPLMLNYVSHQQGTFQTFQNINQHFFTTVNLVSRI